MQILFHRKIFITNMLIIVLWTNQEPGAVYAFHTTLDDLGCRTVSVRVSK